MLVVGPPVRGSSHEDGRASAYLDDAHGKGADVCGGVCAGSPPQQHSCEHSCICLTVRHSLPGL